MASSFPAFDSDDESPEKRPKLSIFSLFSSDTKAVESLKKSFFALCSTSAGALATLTINQCNAAYAKYGKTGKSFSQADVDATTNCGVDDLLFHFGTLFQDAFYALQSYLDNPDSPPADNQMELILSKLLTYLMDEDQQKILKTISDAKMYDCDLMVQFAEHLFGQLGVSSSYIIDKYCRNCTDMRCSCGCEKNVNSNYGDTSIGHVKVWHGCLDIILNGCFLPVAFIDKTPDSPREKSSIEVKVSSDLEDSDVTSRLLAQTIVFSFAEKKKHPEYKSFLIPSIGVNKRGIIFHFYDYENDILLKSPVFSFLHANGEINFVSILATWFVLNYKFLCTGLPKDILKEIKKANFLKMADCLLPIYQKDLSTGGDIRCDRSTKHYEPVYLPCQFVKLPEQEAG